jgi:hypothetical protein
MSHINQPSVSSDIRRLIKTLILPPSVPTSDYRYRDLPESPNNLSVRRHMIPDHVHSAGQASSDLEASLFACVPRGVPADP